jgi:hypothetical protein
LQKSHRSVQRNTSSHVRPSACSPLALRFIFAIRASSSRQEPYQSRKSVRSRRRSRPRPSRRRKASRRARKQRESQPAVEPTQCTILFPRSQTVWSGFLCLRGPRLIQGTMRERHPRRFSYTSMSRLQSASSAIPSVRNADIGSLTHRIPAFLRACRKRRLCWLRCCQTRTTPDRYPLAQP